MNKILYCFATFLNYDKYPNRAVVLLAFMGCYHPAQFAIDAMLALAED